MFLAGSISLHWADVGYSVNALWLWLKTRVVVVVLSEKVQYLVYVRRERIACWVYRREGR